MSKRKKKGKQSRDAPAGDAIKGLLSESGERGIDVSALPLASTCLVYYTVLSIFVGSKVI